MGQIIVLHRVIPESNKERLRNTGIEITEEHLENLIAFFKKKKYEFISLDMLPDYLLGKRKFVIFTLDDGYVDNLTHAYPIFKKHNIPFTIYITTNFPDRKAILWWYLLEELLLEEKKITFKHQNQLISLNLRNRNEKEIAFNNLRYLIKSKQGSNQIDFVSTLFSAYNVPLYQKVEELALNWMEITQLSSDSLVTIGAHTVTHPSFKAISDKQILNEVTQSVEILESKLDTSVDHFAYPYGSSVEVGLREVELVSKTKVKTATTGRMGNLMKAHLNYMHALPRLYVGPTTTERDLTKYINGITPFVNGAKQRIVTV